jgi:hypothetical protein
MVTRRRFVQSVPALGAIGAIVAASGGEEDLSSGREVRKYWTGMLERVGSPVVEALSRGKLKSRMPVEQKPGSGRTSFTHLEAYGRLMAGIAPWLALEEDESPEGRLRKRWVEMSLASCAYAVDPRSPDYMNFSTGRQPLVDAAFLAQALLRAPDALYRSLDRKTEGNLLAALRSAAAIEPYENNWLLFSALIESFFLSVGERHDQKKIDRAVGSMQKWYKGDGVYGDGSEFHWDYYNSYVIHPMLLDVLGVLKGAGVDVGELHAACLGRAQRYALIQERLIAPDGSYPLTGRSLAYRCGAFQLLAQLALSHALPDPLTPAQVRSALTRVIRRTLEAQGTFDNEGWLRIGVCGHQPGIGEEYISTGSLYLCAAVLLPLGLPAGDPFWSSPFAPWTSMKGWRGDDLPADHAL